MANSKKVFVLDFTKGKFGSPYKMKGKTFDKTFTLVY